MSDLIIRHCSPTLAGIKTGSLFSCLYSTREEVKVQLQMLNSQLKCKGLRVLPLKFSKARVLIYVFRPDRLSNDLKSSKASGILHERGYDCSTADRCVMRLISRIRESEEFPHEIGLFLGYPPEDVCGFIENRADCKCTGAWKVYGDVEKAQLLFSRYKKCTELYCQRWANGSSLDRLAVRAAAKA